MMKRIVGIGTIMFGVFGVSSTFAEVSYPCGLYFEINYGASQAEKDYPPDYEVDDNSGPGWNVNAGYKFFPFLAADLGYTRYEDTQLEVGETELTEEDAVDHHYSINLALKGIFPFMNTGIELFGKIGAAWVHSEIDFDDSSDDDDDDDDDNTQSKTGVYVAAGIDYVIAHELSVNVQWARAYGGESEAGTLDLLSAGVSVIFG